MLAGNHVYHTSIVIVCEEYFFNPEGVQAAPAPERLGVPPSHQNKQSTRVVEVGRTRRSGTELLEALRLRCWQL